MSLLIVIIINVIIYLLIGRVFDDDRNCFNAYSTGVYVGMFISAMVAHYAIYGDIL